MATRYQAYYEQNREAMLLRAKTYYQTKKDAIRDRDKKLHKANRDHFVQLYGNKCSICGYNKHLDILEFHHVNHRSKNKELKPIGQMFRYKDRDVIAEQIKECVLLCPNCHAESHLND